jgi:hypothetical protein
LEAAARSDKEMAGRRRSHQLCQADNIGVNRRFHPQHPPQLAEPICHHFRHQFDPLKAALPVANSFIENKIPKPTQEASLLVPAELGKGVEIFIRTRFQTQPPVYFFM